MRPSQKFHKKTRPMTKIRAKQLAAIRGRKLIEAETQEISFPDPYGTRDPEISLPMLATG